MRAALALLLALLPASAGAATALLVLSEPLTSPYREALEGLRAEWGEAIETVSAGRALPRGPYGVIIALGGRAALRAQGTDAPLVVALAPSYRGESRGSAMVRVDLAPSPESFVRILAAMGVHRLIALRSRPADADFSRRIAAAGKTAGVIIEDEIFSATDDLPKLLREIGQRGDAVWMAPDPGAVTAETFRTVREFARARAIPFFAPTAGLATEGIRGELTVSFRDCGKEAARAARGLLAGLDLPGVAYPSPPSKDAWVSISTIAAAPR